MIDTINGATSSAIIYSIVETAKANNLKPYDYFEHLLTEILKHEEDASTDFLKALLRGRKHCRSISGNLLKELTNKDGQKMTILICQGTYVLPLTFKVHWLIPL